MVNASQSPLFDELGRLCLECFEPSTKTLLEQLSARLEALGRRMYLPLDLALLLVEGGYGGLDRLIARGTEGVIDSEQVGARLEVLAAEIDENNEPRQGGAPPLKRANFSRGFTRILEESWAQADGRGDSTVSTDDLLRAVTWRVEAVESASIRWAIRRLREGRGDRLFDERGLLRLDAFDEACQGILHGAMTLAASHGTSFLGTPHLVAIMASIRDSVMWRSARARGLEPRRLREELIRLIGTKPERIPDFLIGRKTLTPRMIRMLQHAVNHRGGEAVRESDLVEAFLADGGSSLELVQALGLESEIRHALGEPRILAGREPVEAAIQYASQRRASPTLDMLGRDLTEEALAGRLPQIVGRERELQRVFNILMRREQRNPLLTGEAGVGKTALAIGLAQQIADGQAPRKLQGYRVIEINGASLMGGTSYRGDLEARIKSLVEEASEQVILFIDEAHAVFAPRSGSNTPAEVPNHFKSALASGTIAVVGATTADEYHRWFEQDPALKRRFERIEVDEPSQGLARHILSSLAPELEQAYDVKVSQEAIASAIDLSVHYLPEQRLPDKAKKLLMDACIACANPLDRGAQRRHGRREQAGAAESGAAGASTSEDSGTPPVVDRDDVAYQVHLKTSIPLDRLLRGEITWWVGLDKRLRQAVVGQDRAMEQIAQNLVSSRLKNADRQRPLSVLAFVGPAGVGKATAARALASAVFYDDRALIRLDMTDYQEAHSLSRLIGSPPGYVGYEDADMLVTPLRRRPSSVVLLEDFDRAHPRIQSRLLRLIEEGELQDTRGHSADARNAIFILTLTTAEESRSAPIGFGDGRGDSAQALDGIDDRRLASRLAGRVDGVIGFVGLSGGDDGGAQSLMEAMIERFVDNMSEEYGVSLSLSPALQEELQAQVKSLHRARDVQNLVARMLVDPAANRLLRGAGGPAMVLNWDAEQAEVMAGAVESSDDD